MQDLKQTIANNITALRTAHSVTQLELAERLNYSDKAVSKWERGESLPDITVLKQIADLFEVTLDYLAEEEHKQEPLKQRKSRLRSRGFITGISIWLVWLIATFVFVVIQLEFPKVTQHWLIFVYAVPVTMVVWLVLNAVWFNKRRNYLIISFLMWSVLAATYLTVLAFGGNPWLIFVLGGPGQIIIWLWSRIGSNDHKTNSR